MKESSKRMLSLLLAVILLLLSLYVFGSFVKPALDDVQQMRSLTASSQKFLESQKQAKASFDGLFKNFENATSIQNLLAMALPGKEGITQTIYQIQALAGVSGVAIDNMAIEVSLSDEKRANISLIKGIGKIRVDLRATSSYENLKTFVSAIESNIKLMDIVEARIEPIKGGGSGLTYDLVIETYYQN